MNSLGNRVQFSPYWVWGVAGVAGLILGLSLAGAAEEPAYCDPRSFYGAEVRLDAPRGIRRLRAFQLGKTRLVGLAVGQSWTPSIEKLARTSGGVASEPFCTWYLNDGNPFAAGKFNWRPLPNPGKVHDPATIYGAILNRDFLDEASGFIGCAERHGYIAVGCDGQMHRGPSVFAMILAFSGCTPAHATEIANRLWGLNGVPAAHRLAVARKGAELGASAPARRARLAALLSGR